MSLPRGCRVPGYVATTTQEKHARMPGRYFHTGFIRLSLQLQVPIIPVAVVGAEIGFRSLCRRS